jgi:DNA-binding transcriptional MerR regulator/methylmalonyl-CoA mutase cobalamin-binding subunit
MYTIKEAAGRAGISVPVARAWERRYGVVRPARTKSGYRLYDDAAIARLGAMHGLVEAGWSPSAAAAHLAAVADADLPRAAPTAEPRAAGRVADTAAAASAGDFAQQFVSASAAFDTARVERLLDEATAGASFEPAAERYLLPALRALGEAWASGRLDVAAEHTASHAVMRRFAAAYQAAARPGSERRGILVGMPPGARHELGALAFAVAARRAGLPVVYLGADLPIEDWIQAARRTRPRAVVIGAPTRDDRRAAIEVARALRDAQPALVVAFGGRAAPEPEAFADLRATEGRRATIRLPDGLVESVDTLASALNGG